MRSCKLILAKKLSEKQKEQIVKLFTSGKSIDQLSKEFNFTKITISRNLKRNLGEEKYKELFKKNKLTNQTIKIKEKASSFNSNSDLNAENEQQNINDKELLNKNSDDRWQPQDPFKEIVPLTYNIDIAPQKDCSSIPISDVDFPKIVYMIVNNKIELETKFLRDCNDWQFLAEDELNRKVIEIYNDMKIARRFCNKEQKVIKVPNTDIFRIVASILISRGITRIVNADKLIAL